MPFRLDRSELRKPTRTPEGFIRADGHLTRTGVLEYRRPDGSIQREYRPEEEVFHQDSLDSIRHATLVLDHPSQPVTKENWKKLSIGEIGQDVRRDSDKVLSTVLVKDAGGIKDVESKKREQLSGGYKCDLEMTPGEWNGIHYDAIQRNIRYNHVALVPRGRAGPEVRLHMDALDAELVADELDETLPPLKIERSDTEPTPGVLVKKKINGVEYEVTDQVGQALDRQDALGEVLAAEVKTSKAALEAEQKKTDELDKKLKEAEKVRADAIDPKKVREAVKARVALLELARPHLDKAGVTKLDDSSDKEIHQAVLAKLSPSFKCDGKSDDAIAGAFELVLSLKKDTRRADHRAGLNPIPGIPLPTVTNTDSADDILEQAYIKHDENNASAFRVATAKAQ